MKLCHCESNQIFESPQMTIETEVDTSAVRQERLKRRLWLPRYPPMQPMQPMHYYPPQPHMHGLPASGYWNSVCHDCILSMFKYLHKLYFSCDFFTYHTCHCFQLLLLRQGHKCTTLMHRIRTILATMCQFLSRAKILLISLAA